MFDMNFCEVKKMDDMEKPKYGVAKNVIWMCKIAWHHRVRVLLFCVFLAVLEVLLNLTQLYIAPEVIAKVENREPVTQLLMTIGVFTAALFVIQGVKSYVETNTLFSRVDVRCVIIGMISQKAMATSFSNTLKNDYNRLRAKSTMATEGNAQATEHIWETLTKLLQNIGGLIVYLTILLRVNGILLAIVAATCVVSFLASVRADNWTYAHRDEEEKYFQKKYYLRSTAESIEFAKDIRIFGLQPWLNEVLDHMHNLYLDWRLRAERVSMLADLTAAVMTIARNAIAYVYLINLTFREGLSVSEFLLYFTAVSTFTSWIMGILKEAAVLHRESQDISRVREYLEYPEDFKFEDGESVPEADGYEIALEHVSYRYPGADADTIHEMNLKVHPGEKLAIVGLNGAGKTTLVKLMCGLLDPTEGRVLLNGKDIRELNRRAVYELFSAVFQEFSVLDVTVAENIAQVSEDGASSLKASQVATPEKCIDYDRLADCIEKAGLTETVAKLPKGVHTHVGRKVYLDGVLFSGGQTQRLMLARALYKDGPILLLDEPTAALDPIAENDIYEKYSEMTHGKTSLFISHRLASTRFCDRIIFVADGGIKEEGTHECLLAAGGVYAELFEVQSRYYQEGRAF